MTEPRRDPSGLDLLRYSKLSCICLVRGSEALEGKLQPGSFTGEVPRGVAPRCWTNLRYLEGSTGGRNSGEVALSDAGVLLCAGGVEAGGEETMSTISYPLP